MRHTTSSKKDNNEKKDNECPGVCVADRIADYCEAYLRTPNLCKGGTKCCVAKDQYLDDPDLRILINTQNSSKTPSKPQKATEKVSYFFFMDIRNSFYGYCRAKQFYFSHISTQLFTISSFVVALLFRFIPSH